jgi:hypothetical protein
MPTASGGCPVVPRVRDGTARYGWRPGDQAASPLARRGPRIEPQSADHLEGCGSRPRARTRRSGEAPNRHCEVSTSLVTTQKVGGSTPSWDATKVAPRAVTPPSSNPGAPIESHQAMRKRLETAGQSCRRGRVRAPGAGSVLGRDSLQEPVGREVASCRRRRAGLDRRPPACELGSTVVSVGHQPSHVSGQAILASVSGRCSRGSSA